MKRFIVAWVLISLIAIGSITYLVINNSDTLDGPSNFKQCTKLSTSIIQESHPRKCITATGAVFTEEVSPTAQPTPIATPTPTEISGGCKVSGCSGTLCVDELDDDISTTCEYKKEYACYELMTCERQRDGTCGWSSTQESDVCFAEAVIEPTI